MKVMKIGSKVAFHHQPEIEYTVKDIIKGSQGTMVELHELPGHFAEHLFKVKS